MDLLNKSTAIRKYWFVPIKPHLALLMYFTWMRWLLYTLLSLKDFLQTGSCRGILQLGLEHLGAKVMWLQENRPMGLVQDFPKKLNFCYLTANALWCCVLMFGLVFFFCFVFVLVCFLI